jgi:ribosomal protein S18 acetylase RimI-like enzyme
VSEKGYPELFTAAETLDDRFVVVVIGPHEPDKADAVDAAVVAAAERNGVRFLGMRTDVDSLYGAMDLFVLPSHREGFPRAAMEAAASGLPVIASDIRGCREVVDDGENGLLVPVRDPDALAAAIERLGNDPALRGRMATAGREKAERDFDEKNIVHTVIASQVRVLREKGDFRRPGSDADVHIRPAVPHDARIIARLHADGMESGFLPRLGLGFLDQLYREMLSRSDAVILVADDGYAPIGFIAGTADVGALYRSFVRRRGVRAAAAAAPRLLRPGMLRRAWETLRYDGAHMDVPAELLSMAVSPAYQGHGLGGRLGAAFLEVLAGRGVDRVKVVVGASNATARAVYRSTGFVDAGAFEVHAGEESVVMLWSQSSRDRRTRSSVMAAPPIE